MKEKNILVLLNEEKDKDFSISKKIVKYLNEHNCKVYVEKDKFENIPLTMPYEKEKVDVTFALILGGDGTLLNYAHKYSSVNFPFFGINLGRVGCLTEATLDNYEQKINEIFKGNYFIEERNTIECEITINDNGVKKEIIKELAFNEVSLQRGRLYKMLLINMLVNNNNKTSFYADGVVVATSTGSSAFSLSCGGPLLLPTARNFVVTPISPQLRTITSLVVNDTDIITLDLSEDKIRESFENEKPMIVFDGYKMIEIDRDDQINIYKSDKKLKIVKVDGHASLFEPTFKVAMSSQNINKK